ncbi:hypothetical protein KGO5_05670 [Sinorhizobium sp. KGO-5]|uniref:hypothetical protein n=1 Tax=Sinorhizobium sp. KGO-5 TaxID=1470810 RepID=UPI00294A07C3|nr:hypothetical protein KGO5_05670 [Sinorhizobium sp. KGO-5]
MSSQARLCILGNSHLAAFRDAWTEHSEKFPDLVPTWFGASRDQLGNMVARKGLLRPKTQRLAESLKWTSGGLEFIDPRNYDAFVIVGLGPSFTGASRIYRAFRTSAQSQDPRPRYLISQAAYHAALDGQVLSSVAFGLAGLLRSLTDAPIFVIADPLPAENALESRERALWSQLLATGDGARLLSQFLRLTTTRVQELPATFIEQPAQTRSQEMFSRDDFRRGAARMREDGDIAFTDEDYGHLGPQYGLILLRELANRIRPAGAVVEMGEPLSDSVLAE